MNDVELSMFKQWSQCCLSKAEKIGEIISGSRDNGFSEKIFTKYCRLIGEGVQSAENVGTKKLSTHINHMILFFETVKNLQSKKILRS